MKYNLNQLKAYLNKDKLSKFVDWLKAKLNKDTLNEIVQKIKEVRKEDIIMFYYKNKNKIYKWLFLSILPVLVIAIVFLSYKTFKVYQTLQKNVNNLSIVSNDKIKNYIRSNSIRVPSGIINTAYILEYWNYNKQRYQRFYKKTLAYLVDIISNKPGKIDVLYSELNLKGSPISLKEEIKDIKEFINRSSLNKLQLLFDNSYIIRKYISSFPNVSPTLIKTYVKNYKEAKLLSNIFKNLYIYEIPSIYRFVYTQESIYKTKYLNNVAPYNNFLTYIFLPSFDIWIDKFSKVVDPNIFWKSYLKKADYIDLNIIRYWGNFFTYSYKWKLYQGEKNTIDSIKLGKIDLLDNNLAKLGLNISFLLNSDKSFYWLISKLTLTSNEKNIMLLNEFTFDLWNNIKSYISRVLPKDFENNQPLGKRWIVYQYYKCVKENSLSCLKLFGCKTNFCKASDISSAVANLEKIRKNIDVKNLYKNLYKLLSNNENYDFKNSSFAKFIKKEYYKINDINVLIWARLYDCIRDNWYCWDLFDKNYSQIRNAIKEFAGCNKNDKLENNLDCKYKFITKFDTNYFVWYTLVDKLGEINYSLIDRLKDVYNNIPAVLQLGKFAFTKPRETDVLASYKANVWLNIFYKYITSDEYNKILSYIWKTHCKLVTSNSSFDLGKAYAYISNRYQKLSQTSTDASSLYDLRRLQNLISEFQKQFNKAPLLDRLLLNLEVYRIFKNRGYCN